jgi:hypothetical protein
VRWYYKAGLIVAMIWATARVLGAYGEASRDLDLSFFFAFMLTLGGWSALFLVIDWIGRAVGLIRQPVDAGSGGAQGGDGLLWSASRWIGRARGASRAEEPPARGAGRAAASAGPASSRAAATTVPSPRAARTKIPATPAAPTAGAARRTSRPSGKSRPRSR